MDANPRRFLDQLLATPGVSGYEQPVQSVVREYASAFAQPVETDVHGNVFAGVNPDGKLRVMLAGHCDQIGLLVSWIDDAGFLFFQTVGGWDPQQLVGQAVTVWTAGGPVPGVIGRKPIHLLDENERKQVASLKSMWIDIGCRSRDEAGERVRVGDSVTLPLQSRELANSLLAGPALDNRCGVWVVLEALRRAALLTPAAAVWAVSTVQEEIGLRGAQTAAFHLAPQVGIAVDVTHATDFPDSDRKQQGQIKLGGGPVIQRGPNVNPRVADRLLELAAEKGIPVQLAALGRAASNDSNVLQISRGGVATGIVAIPNRYMHSGVETVSLDDLEHAANLLAAFCASLTAEQSFVP